MRAGIVGVLALAALVRLVIDWKATAGVGREYHVASIGEALARTWPDTYAGLVAGWQASRIPFLWDPIVTSILSLPFALVIGLLAVAFWVGRARPQAR